jgi:hypothetical protein
VCPLGVVSREFIGDERTNVRTTGPDRRQDLADTLARL